MKIPLFRCLSLQVIPSTLGGVSFIDAIGGGKVVINARGTGVFFR